MDGVQQFRLLGMDQGPVTAMVRRGVSHGHFLKIAMTVVSAALPKVVLGPQRLGMPECIGAFHERLDAGVLPSQREPCAGSECRIRGRGADFALRQSRSEQWAARRLSSKPQSLSDCREKNKHAAPQDNGRLRFHPNTSECGPPSVSASSRPTRPECCSCGCRPGC